MNFLKITDLKEQKIKKILKKSSDLKEKKKKSKPHHELKNKNIGLFFEEPSTRTRISFAAGISDLGSNSVFMDQKQLQLKRGESLKDTAKVLSSYLDAITIRSLNHEKVKELAKHSSIPVINAMTKIHHPCQSLADLLTIQEHKNTLRNLTFTWVGDGNNVCHSSILANSLMNIKTKVATPRGYEPNKEIIEQGKKLGGNIELFNNPKKAIKDTDIVYTDVWFSTGENITKKKKNDFAGFQINKELIKEAKRDVIVMHCMPIKGNEISREILETPNSVIYEQAENRLHTEKALLIELMKK